MKLIVVSNRLPITVKRTNTGFEYKHSSGGLVTGLSSIKEKINFLWFGNISSAGLSEDDKSIITEDCMNKFNSVPIFIDPELNNESYNGFCNAILWPSLHYFDDDVCFTEKNYEAYKKYNKIFEQKISDIADPGDIVWVHDYHLMILPSMLRERWESKLKIMFFLHTPFPDAISMNRLECRKDILSSIVSCDLVTFHSYDYLINFKECCDKNMVETNAKMDAIPIGIDPKIFTNALENDKTQKRIKEIKDLYKGKKIILGVDRTDYIKGIPQRIQGYKRFLEKYSELRDKVIYLQVGVPSRLGVKEYQEYVSLLNKLTTEINSGFGNINSSYMHLLNNSVDFDELCALYAASDVLLITSLRDGMNLVAMEYITCQDDNKGNIILSDFAGAFSTLPGSIPVNAWSIEEIADSIYKAVSMEQDTREKNFKINKEAVYKFTSYNWAEKNLNALCSNWEDSIKKK